MFYNFLENEWRKHNDWFSYFERKRWNFYPDLDFLWWEKGKEEKRHKNFTKRKVVFFFLFFSLYLVLISFLVFLLVFSKLGNSVTMKGCWWEGWAVIPQRYPPVVPGSVGLSELSEGGVCAHVNSGISSSDVLQWEFFFFLEQGRKPKPDHSWFYVSELYPF